ncbi:MAG: S-layer homology domain-containing protein [Syntrophomonadaceae bacterium]
MNHKRLGLSLFMILLLFSSVVIGAFSVSAASDYLEVTPSSNTIDIGGTATYQATLYTSGGGVIDVTNTCTWTIDDSTIAAPGAAGTFTGTASGTTTVTAVYPKPMLSASAGLTVNSPKVQEPILIILPSTNTINVGDIAAYKAYLQFSDGNPDQDVTDECTWDIYDPAIASISAVNGEYLGLTVGTTTVTAHLVRKAQTLTIYRPALDLTAKATLTVVQKQKQAGLTLEVTPPTATIWVGDSQQYEAILHYSDGTPDQDVTSAATWSLSTSIATSSSNGLYQGATPGTATVTATYTPSSYSELSDDATLIVKKKGGGKDVPPPTENLPLGKIIDRQPGYITLCDPQNLDSPGEEFTMTYDPARMDSNPDRHPKVFYWNTTYEKWIALASYPISPGQVKAINDGRYSGWFVVMGCIQPTFIDVYGNWAEKWVNRMNGLGLLEGYPDPTGGLQRPAGLDRIIIRSELTASVACILGLAPGDTKLYPTITFLPSAQNDAILNAHYSDADEIADWARPYVAAMTQAGYVGGIGNRFAPNNQLTRIEAAVIISNALRDVPGFGTRADLSVFTDYSEVPSWAIGKVAQGTIGGYPDGTLRPNQPITRAETCALLITLLRGLGW